MAAIYCPTWPKEVTTTLYPVDVTDTVVFGITLASGRMELLPTSGPIAPALNMLSGTLVQERWFVSDGPYDSGPITSALAMLGGTLIQERWFLSDGPYDSGPITSALSMLDGTLVNKLVIADSPDESLQLGARINSSCSMELI